MIGVRVRIITGSEGVYHAHDLETPSTEAAFLATWIDPRMAKLGAGSYHAATTHDGESFVVLGPNAGITIPKLEIKAAIFQLLGENKC